MKSRGRYTGRISTPAITMRRSALALLVLLCAALAGCGQKGPLVRPDGSAPAAAHSAQAPAPDLPNPTDDNGR